MNRKFMILALSLVVLMMTGQAFAGHEEGDTMTVRAEASRNDTVLTQILVDLPFNIDIYMNNRDTTLTDPQNGYRMAYSMPFVFHDSGYPVGTVIQIDSGGETGTENVITKNSFDTYWNYGFFYFPWSWDGSLPDSINLTGISGNGWPNDLGEQLYIRFAFQISNTGKFCIDSIGGQTETFDWLLDDPSPAFHGPYCWDVVAGSAVAEEDNQDLLPKEFELSQNYPNPFNPTTVIDYALPTKADVNISIYNILGQRITTLVSGEKPAGYHSTVWNGTTADGSPAASGIYFYKIQAGEFNNTKKLMLLK